MTGISNVSLAAVLFSPYKAQTIKAAFTPPAPANSASAARRNEPITPIKPIAADQQSAKARHLRVVSDDSNDPKARRSTKVADQALENERSASVSSFQPSAGLTAQLLAQDVEEDGSAARRALAGPASTLSEHRESARLGSNAYRLSGAEPDSYSENATLIRLAV